ncbi:MAG: GAF domain-containing protein, partial [Anaerolineae bacterium]
MSSLGVVVVLGVFGVLSVRALEQSTERFLSERLLLAQQIADHIDHHLESTLTVLEEAADTVASPVQRADGEAERAVLEELFRTELFSCHVFLADRQGKVLLTVPDIPGLIGVDLSDQEHVARALKEGRPQVSNLFRCPRPLNSLDIAFVVPVKDRDGDLIALLGGVTDPRSQSFSNIVDTLSLEEDLHVEILDGNGMVLASTAYEHVLMESLHRDSLLPLIESRQAGIGTYPGADERDREVVAIAPLEEAPWSVTVEQPEAEVLAPIFSLRRTLVFVGLFALLAAVILIGLNIYTWITPLRELQEATRRIAAGDLSTPLVVSGRDEVARLAGDFESMRRQLVNRREILETEVAERTRHLSALNQMARSLSTTLDQDELLEIAYREITAVLSADAFFIALYDEENKELDFRIRVDEGERKPPRRCPLGEGLIARVISGRKPLLVRDWEDESEHLPPIDLCGLIRPPSSWLGVPIIVDERVLGVVVAQAYRPNVYGEDDQVLLCTLVDQVGLALRNTMRYAREQKLARYLRSLNHAIARASAGLDVDTVARTVTETLVEECGAAFARLWLTDQTGEYLLLRASSGLYTRLNGSRARVSIAEYPYKLGLIARQRKPLITNRVQQEPYFDREWAQSQGLVAFAGYPILVEEKLLGVVALFSRSPLDEEMLDVLGAFVNQVGIALANARLFEETQHRARQLSLVGEIARRAVASFDPDELLWETARAIHTAFGYHDVVIFLVDHERHQLIRKAWAGKYRREPVADLPKPIEEVGILDWVAVHGETVLLNDVHQDERYVPFWKETESELCVPIKDGDTVLGGINVESEVREAFDQSDVQALETLADNLVVALRNAHLYQETQRRLRELSTLFEISGTLRGAATVTEMLPLVLEKTIEVLHADTGVFFRWNTVEERFVVQAAHGCLKSLLGVSIGASEGVCGHVAKSGSPYVFASLAEDSHTAEWLRPLVRDVQGGVCVPLMVRKHLVGALLIGNESPRSFSADEVHLLNAIANMAASAIHRAGLFEQLEHRVHELDSLFEMSRVVTATLRTEDVLTLVVRSARRALNAEG